MLWYKCITEFGHAWLSFITVTSWWTRWRVKSPTPRLFVQPFVQAQIKNTLKLRVTGHGWPGFPPYKGPVTRKMFPFDDVVTWSTLCQIMILNSASIGFERVIFPLINKILDKRSSCRWFYALMHSKVAPNTLSEWLTLGSSCDTKRVPWSCSCWIYINVSWRTYSIWLILCQIWYFKQAIGCSLHNSRQYYRHASHSYILGIIKTVCS